MTTHDVAHYDAHAAAMRNLDFFYVWMRETVERYVARDAAICDVGCGTGALLHELAAAGYTQLAGTDFSAGCLALAARNAPGALLLTHDICAAPLPTQYDALVLACVLDFLPEPQRALNNLRASLRPGGRLLLHFRNRQAYWPWYHLRHVFARLPAGRVRHWALHFSTPLGLRRSDQPFERVYAPAEIRALLAHAGLQPVARAGAMMLPMVWLPELPTLVHALARAERPFRQLPPWRRHYQLLYVCETP